jgi:hypothetical protein
MKITMLQVLVHYTDVSEERISSIFKVEESGKQESSNRPEETGYSLTTFTQILKTEAIYSSEIYWATQRYNPEHSPV